MRRMRRRIWGRASGGRLRRPWPSTPIGVEARGVQARDGGGCTKKRPGRQWFRRGERDPEDMSSRGEGRGGDGARRGPVGGGSVRLGGDGLSLPFSRSRYLGAGCGPWSWASDTTDTQRGPPWLRPEPPRSGFSAPTHAPTGDVNVAGTARRQELTPLADCSDDGGRRPSASRRFGLRLGAPPVLAPGRPSPGRGGCGPRGSR